MGKISHEFFCQTSNGGCGGYFRVPLDDEEERDVILICPQCRHAHQRGIKGGHVTERRHAVAHDDERVHLIEPPLAAYSKQARGGFWERLVGPGKEE